MIFATFIVFPFLCLDVVNNTLRPSRHVTELTPKTSVIHKHSLQGVYGGYRLVPEVFGTNLVLRSGIEPLSTGYQPIALANELTKVWW